MKIKYPPIVQVSENGEEIGPIEYQEAHKTGSHPGIRHSTINALIFEDTSKKRFFSQRRSSKVSGGEGKLDISFGAHIHWYIDKNRAFTPIETAAYESQQELFYQKDLPSGLVLEEVCAFPKQTRNWDREYVHLFDGVFPGPFSPNPNEVSEILLLNTESALRDIGKNPERYTRTLGFDLNKYLEARG